ncbi:MAG: adenosylcobinamide-GDP ribazoletransferase [Pseudomonadota bacterium]
MAERQSVIELRDVPAALGFLSRLPIAVNGEWAAARGARIVWAYPIAGAVLGAFVVTLAALLALWLPSSMAAAFALAGYVALTGALHEDGLADTADGLWGGWTRERRLQIMKDSRIGAYGVIALTLSLLLRWLGFTVLVEGQAWWALAAIPAATRAAMAPLMALPQARPGGVSAQVGRPLNAAIGISVTLGLIALAPLGTPAIALLISIAVGASAMALIASAKIRGQTGDILGATQQICEILALSVAVALLT